MGLTAHQVAAADPDDGKVRDVRIQLSLQRWWLLHSGGWSMLWLE
jgi:hypothetical protein